MTDIDLSNFGAPGFKLKEDLDFTGHPGGNVDPHVNSRIVNPAGITLMDKRYRDLSNNQLPGFNGMQDTLIPLDK